MSVRSFDEMYPALARMRPARPREVGDMEAVLERARRFRDDVVEPNALAIDRRAGRDPRYVAEDVLREAARDGWFSLTVPRMLGGSGVSFAALTIGLEEIAAGCVGIANLVAVHGLAVCTVAATGDARGIAQLCEALVEGEQRERPTLLSTAITEPGAGTDAEDRELLRTANLDCEARPVLGGYRLRGRKVFISNGSIARTHVVLMPTDRRDPVGTTYVFLVDADTPGFSVGRVERKMGQKACPAAELVFDDCFVPESRRLCSRPIPLGGLELVLGATRGGVAAFAAGVARGAYERAVAYARTHRVAGKKLIDHQWAQFRLADMWRNVTMARAAYVEAMAANELFGLSGVASGGRLDSIARRLPTALVDRGAVRGLVTSQHARRGVREMVDGISGPALDISCAYGAGAKVSATDLAMESCHLAIDLMGGDGIRHDRGMEKLFRDARLLQIYEGTNELNRIEVFNKAVRAREPAEVPRAAE